MSSVKKKMKILYYYFFGKYIFANHYDKRYLKGRHFEGAYHGIAANGWRWIVCSYKDCKRKGVNLGVPWPVSSDIRVVNPENISFHVDDLNNFQGFGNYYQAIGRITIGKGSYIAPNVGLITANHSIDELDKHDPPKSIVIGDDCWIGMNAMLLPGVVLGNNTIVGAGSVVTKSFEDGNCVIAGNPARVIKTI